VGKVTEVRIGTDEGVKGCKAGEVQRHRELESVQRAKAVGESMG
jgi:hypothetical protein